MTEKVEGWKQTEREREGEREGERYWEGEREGGRCWEGGREREGDAGRECWILRSM